MNGKKEKIRAPVYLDYLTLWQITRKKISLELGPFKKKKIKRLPKNAIN